MPNDKSRCSALNKSGKPCNAPPIQPEGLCFGHHPKAGEWRKKGGRPRKRAALTAHTPIAGLMGDSALQPLLRNLEEILEQVHREDLDPDRARATVTVANAILKTLDKTDDFPLPEPEPVPVQSDPEPSKWIFDDPPDWLIEKMGYARGLLESHEERLETDEEYREQWMIEEEERLRDEEDFYYAATKALQTLENADISQPPSDDSYRDAADEVLWKTFSHAIAEREEERANAPV